MDIGSIYTVETLKLLISFTFILIVLTSLVISELALQFLMKFSALFSSFSEDIFCWKSPNDNIA